MSIELEYEQIRESIGKAVEKGREDEVDNGHTSLLAVLKMHEINRERTGKRLSPYEAAGILILCKVTIHALKNSVHPLMSDLIQAAALIHWQVGGCSGLEPPKRSSTELLQQLGIWKENE